MAEKSKKDEAQAQFRKMQRAEDGKKAMTEYEAEAIATRAKTERLKALRLARDAATPAPEPKKPARKKSAAKSGATAADRKSAAKGEGKTLADWMDAEKASGRNH